MKWLSCIQLHLPATSAPAISISISITKLVHPSVLHERITSAIYMLALTTTSIFEGMSYWRAGEASETLSGVGRT